jgi:hypothetical protein
MSEVRTKEVEAAVALMGQAMAKVESLHRTP